MEAREVAKELKREGWYARGVRLRKYYSSNRACAAKAGGPEGRWHSVPSVTLQTSCPTEENGLPAGKHNFFSFSHNEDESPVFLEAWLFHVT
jgi:hypothetical protein